MTETTKAAHWARIAKRHRRANTILAEALAATGEAKTIERSLAATAQSSDAALTAWAALERAMNLLDEGKAAGA